MYMTYDVDEYARLYALTRNTHFCDVADLLLHATTAMISLPDRLFDLVEEGWQHVEPPAR